MDPVRRDRLEQLASRVRWLDRYRRALSIGLALVFCALIGRELSDAFEAPWPNLLVTLVSLMFSTLAWWCTEAALAWLTALWDTEHAHLLRDRGLPRAELIQRRR